jgi:L-iditol 2-dehydrogenase
MKAAVFLGPERMEVMEIPTPSVSGPWEMLVKVRACSVCGSDIRIFHYGNPRITPPAVMGHEIVGDVVDVGEEVKGFRIGDRVAIGADVPCGICEMCRKGLGNNCPLHYSIGYQFPGGFAEYVLLSETTVKYGPVQIVPDGVSDLGATLAEPLGCCINGMELAGLKPGETVVVIGTGPIGCMLIELARYLGAGKIIAVQRSRKRLEMAKGFPADVFICTEEEDPVRRVLEETDGEGADIVFTAAVSPEAQEWAVKMVAHRGRVNLFAGLPPGSPPVPLDTNLIHYREAFVFGSHGSVPRHHKLALRIIERGGISSEKYITHTFPLDRILDAFEAVERRDAMKTAIVFQ